MGMLIAIASIVLGSLAIGVTGGIYAGRTHQWALSVLGTIASYYALIGIPWALLIMEPGGASPRAFAEAFLALARSLLLLGLVPLMITFAISAAVTR